MAGTSGWSPFRGGSTQMTWGRTPSPLSLAATVPASPQKNSVFSTPFLLAFSLASWMAWGTISAPITFAALRERAMEMVPMPQYRSSTVSLPVRAAKSRATAYSRSVCAWLIWKKDGTDRRKV